MRRAMAGIAVIAAGLLFTAGCSLGGASPGGSAPSTDGIGPITFAIGKDNPGWPQGVITETVFRRYGLDGYAGTFAPYEGLTVNFAEAVQSAGGSILSPEGTKVTGRRSVSRWRLTTTLAGSALDGAAARRDDDLIRWNRFQPSISGA